MCTVYTSELTMKHQAGANDFKAVLAEQLFIGRILVE